MIPGHGFVGGNGAGMTLGLPDFSVLAAEVVRRAIPDIERLIQAEFDQGCDPYGERWAPFAGTRKAVVIKGKNGRKSRIGLTDGTPVHLTDTHSLRMSVAVEPGPGTSVRVDINSPYASFHQDGTKTKSGQVRMPAREILPTHGVPSSWDKALSNGTEAALAKVAA